MGIKGDRQIWTGSRRQRRIDFRKPFCTQEIIFTALGAKGIQRLYGSHYKNFN